MIRLEKITHRYSSPEGGGVVAVENVNLSVAEGKFVALKGPSGCGKSTLLLIAGGLLRPTSGDLEIAGVEPYKLALDERAAFRASTIGFVFQQFHLVPYLDVLDNVLAPSIASGRKDRKRAEALVEQFGLTPRAYHTPSALSTGERQRAAMARALYNKPKVLLADEPTGNLDPENADIVLKQLVAFADQGGAVLMVTHASDASAVADEIITLGH